MAEEKKETWLNYLALATVMFAVVWVLGLVTGVVGSAYFANGFLLFLK